MANGDAGLVRYSHTALSTHFFGMTIPPVAM